MKQVMPNDPSKRKYILRNPEKYLGNPNNIVIRSSWEKYAFEFCDNNPYILAWHSEEICIDYMKPIFVNGRLTTRPGKYFPDLYVEYYNSKNEYCRELIEVKPAKQARPSKARSQSTKFYENYVYIVNSAKWAAAQVWCEQRNIKFSVVTENKLFPKKNNK